MKRSGIIQNYSDLLTSLKEQVINSHYRFILSGSLLGVNVNDVLLNPTGYVDEIEMYPLDFEEHLWSKNVGQDSIDYVKDCFIKNRSR